MPDASVAIGLNSAEFEAGLSKLGSGLKSALGGLGIGLGMAAVTAEMEKAMDKAHAIHHEAERFGIDAQQLQLIGNAAQESGISLEAVARSMRFLIDAEDSATKGNQKMGDAFATLGINLRAFQALNPAEKMLAVSAALQKAGLNTQTFAAAGELLGKRFGTELIPVLLKGPEAIRASAEAMGLMDTKTVNELDKAYKTWQSFWNKVVILTGQAMGKIGEAISQGAGGEKSPLDKFITNMDSARDAGVRTGTAVAAAWAGVKNVFSGKFGEGWQDLKDAFSGHAAQQGSEDFWRSQQDTARLLKGTGQFVYGAKKPAGAGDQSWQGAGAGGLPQSALNKLEDQGKETLEQLAARSFDVTQGTAFLKGQYIGKDILAAQNAMREKELGQQASIAGKEDEAQQHFKRYDQITAGIGSLKSTEKNQTEVIKSAIDGSDKMNQLIEQTKGIGLND